MSATIEEKKAEAVKRMRRLGIFKPTIKDFEKNGLVCVSEPPYGAFYYIEDEDRQRIDEFEKKYNGLVYMVVRSYLRDGDGPVFTMDNMLYVSDYPEEWDMDNELLDDGIVLAYVYNSAEPFFSESGDIRVQRTVAGGLVRVF